MFGQESVTANRNGGATTTVAMQAPSSAASGQQLKLDKHRLVFRAGDDAERFFEVESGCVMVYRILDDGRRQVVEVVFPGGICGLAAGEFHESSCETMPSVLRSYRNIELDRSEALRARVVERLQRQMSSMHEHAVSLGRKTAQERVCSFVLSLRAVNRANPESGAKAPFSIVLPMSRTEMADYLGLTLETVCRTFSDLTRRKLLSAGSSKSEVRVPNLGRLCVAASWDLH